MVLCSAPPHLHRASSILACGTPAPLCGLKARTRPRNPERGHALVVKLATTSQASFIQDQETVQTDLFVSLLPDKKMSTKDEPLQTHSIGQLVSGRVERIFPFGVFVRLDGGTRAYIRRRELSWEGDVDPRELLTEGQEIEAVVLQLPEPGRSMELSRRALLHDPWQEFAGKFRRGDVVVAIVQDLAPTGVFVRIAAGVDGFIPREELAPWKVERPEDVVWIGDRLEAEIIQIYHVTHNRARSTSTNSPECRDWSGPAPGPCGRLFGTPRR